MAVMSGNWLKAQGSRLKGTTSSLQPPASSRFRGQTLLEYVITIVLVAAALAGMAVYAKRTLAGSWRGVADQFGHGRQFDPFTTTCLPGPC